jgi:predicted DNA-binding protein with PD1-like motif
MLIDEQDRVYAVIFDTGEDPMEGLERFAADQNLDASSFAAIGAFSEAMLGSFDWEKKDYEHIPVREQTEVLALVGDITLDEASGRKVHAHVVLGKRDGAACGGTCGAKAPGPGVIPTSRYPERRHDPASGSRNRKIDDWRPRNTPPGRRCLLGEIAPRRARHRRLPRHF